LKAKNLKEVEHQESCLDIRLVFGCGIGHSQNRIGHDGVALPFTKIFTLKKLSQNREDPRYVVVSNLSRNPYGAVGISLILLVDETQNEKVDGRQRTNLNTLGSAFTDSTALISDAMMRFHPRKNSATDR
jgi:hypothetical protein